MQGADADWLRDRLRGTRLADDPATVELPPNSSAWSDEFRAELTRDLQLAGVLVPIIDRPESLTVLLTLRSAALRNHAGQIAFPGGRMETGDRDLCATALREAHEEVGLLPGSVEILGFLPPMSTVTRFAVTPVVGLLPESTVYAPDNSEVDAAFEVPLDFLLDERNEQTVERTIRKRPVPVTEFRFGEHRIWGATAHMIVRLRDMLKDQ